jgi:dienelactone hydrolase
MNGRRSIEHDFENEHFRSEWRPVEEPRATLILFPTVAGITDVDLGFADDCNAKGANVFVADLYGAQFRGGPRSAGNEQMRRIQADRANLRDRLLAVLDVVQGLDETRGPIVAIGFCFGGLCALDLARSGAAIAGAASFHGIFAPTGLATVPITARVLACHGWDDPFVPPPAVAALARELTDAGADWEILALGNTVHGFTNPGADALGNPAVKYSPVAAARAWRAFDNMLDDLTAG